MNLFHSFATKSIQTHISTEHECGGTKTTALHVHSQTQRARMRADAVHLRCPMPQSGAMSSQKPHKILSIAGSQAKCPRSNVNIKIHRLQLHCAVHRAFLRAIENRRLQSLALRVLLAVTVALRRVISLLAVQ